MTTMVIFMFMKTWATYAVYVACSLVYLIQSHMISGKGFVSYLIEVIKNSLYRNEMLKNMFILFASFSFSSF